MTRVLPGAGRHVRTVPGPSHEVGILGKRAPSACLHACVVAALRSWPGAGRGLGLPGFHGAILLHCRMSHHTILEASGTCTWPWPRDCGLVFGPGVLWRRQLEAAEAAFPSLTRRWMHRAGDLNSSDSGGHRSERRAGAGHSARDAVPIHCSGRPRGYPRRCVRLPRRRCPVQPSFAEPPTETIAAGWLRVTGVRVRLYPNTQTEQTFSCMCAAAGRYKLAALVQYVPLPVIGVRLFSIPPFSLGCATSC